MVETGLPAQAVTTTTRNELAPALATPPAQPDRRARQRGQSRTHAFAVAASLTLFVTDALALLLAFSGAYRLHDVTGLLGPTVAPSGRTYQELVGLAIAATLVVFTVTGMYTIRRAVSRIDELYRVVTRVSIGLVIAIAATSIIRGEDFVYSRQMVAYGWALALASVTTGRFLHAALIGSLRARGVAVDRLLIVGTGPSGHIVLDKVRRSPQLGYQVIGFVRQPDDVMMSSTNIDIVPVLGLTTDLANIVAAYDIDELIIALSGTPHEEVLELVYAVMDYPVAIRLYPDTFRLLTSDTLDVADLGGLPTVNVRTIGLRPFDRALKRSMDLVVSAGTLVFFAPMMALIALAIKLTSRGPVFYIQERVGQDGRAFQLIKFRTMLVDAEATTGPVFTSKDDPRRTRFGRLLRRYSLDELPQFINVLLGEMSIVGPRPERPYFVEQFSRRIPAYKARHHEKAGITGWAQVNSLRGDTSIEERTRYDLYYVENWSPLFDIRIMIKTLAHIVKRDNNAY